MAKANNKTTQTAVSPSDFIARIEHKTRRADAEFLLPWFTEITGLKPKMWGPTMIGYGRYHYKYESGREGDALMTGFSPRKTGLVFYIMPGFQTGTVPEMLGRLGKHKTGKSCLYVNKLADIDIDVLGELVRDDVAVMRRKYQTWNV